MKQALFKVGDEVFYRGKLGVVTRQFWSDAPGHPDAAHNRYYVTQDGFTHSVAEASLTPFQITNQNSMISSTENSANSITALRKQRVRGRSQ